MLKSDTESFDLIARSNVNAAWGALTIEVLARLGVETVVTSPGSRSTPLTVAAARNTKIEALTILDERSAGFYALGIAQRTHRPVALVCTSGSAAANYFPAVVEASMSGIPLLLLTADRPPEMRDCSSGQTIDQVKLFGDYVRNFQELAIPEVSSEMLRYLRQSLVHAVNLSLGPNAGPVHLNFPFRDPLAPELDCLKPVVDKQVMEMAATVQARPCESINSLGSIDAVVLERLSSHQRGIIVVGTVNPVGGDESFADAVSMISSKLGWPVLADVLNPLRHHAGEGTALISSYDAFLRKDETCKHLQPTAILQIGSLPTSKVLRRWLSSLDAVSFLCTVRPVNSDPLHRIATPIYSDALALAEQIQHLHVDEAWVQAWMQTNNETVEALDARLGKENSLFEGKVAWLLGQHLPLKTQVFIANSMSVRYAEYFWSVGSRGYSVACNRGANGIDGTLSSALGLAHAGKPTVLLTGDLAFLHDSNGLLAIKQFEGSLTILLINNDGGGIFEHLPVVSMDPPFEQYFATPQSVDLPMLCRAYNVTHQKILNWEGLVEAISQLPVDGVRVLEIQTDRKSDRELLRQILG